jgi:hypothetical protein
MLISYRRFVGEATTPAGNEGTSTSILRKQFSEISPLLIPSSARKHGQVYFLLSTRWYHLWYSYVTNWGEQQGSAPGPIDNWDLAYCNNDLIKGSYKESRYNACRFKLRDGLEEDKDFVCMPLAGWDALRYWYGGGPPFPRVVFQAAPSEPATLALYPSNPLCVREAISGNVSLLSSAGCSTSSGSAVLGTGTLTSVSSDDSTDSRVRKTPTTPTAPPSPASQVPAMLKKKAKLLESSPRVMNDCGKSANTTGSYCFTCRNPAKSKCSRCSAVNYCSRECQMVSMQLKMCPVK